MAEDATRQVGDADVLIVGAGPAGSALATLLGREGLRVLLLDRAAKPPPKICGEYLSPGCLPILDRLGALAAIRQAGARRLRGMWIHTAGGRTLCGSYPEDAAGTLHGLSIPRSRLDPLLLGLALRQGVAFEPWFQVSDLLWENGRVVGVSGRLQGRWTSRRGCLVVGADGRHSVVAARLGGTRRHPWLDRMAVVTYLTGISRAEDVGEIFLGRDCYGILNPIAPDLTNIGLVVNRKTLRSGEDPRRGLWAIAQGLPGLGDRLRTARMVAPVRCLGPLAYRAVNLAAPGALLVGDAAGFLDPFTGEGIHAALRSAELAAHHILAAWKQQARALPDPTDYARAWRDEFEPKWRFCLWLQQAIRRPWLAEGVAGFLAPRPQAITHLLAAAGDLLPAADLRPLRLATRLVTRSGPDEPRRTP